MDKNVLDILELSFTISGTIVGIGGIIFGFWQYFRITKLRKVTNDHVRSLYRDSQRILQLAVDQKIKDITEKGISIKHSVILLDITNRNLNIERIDKLKEKGILTEGEANEYKNFSSD
jgi:hypothetical protein